MAPLKFYHMNPRRHLYQVNLFYVFGECVHPLYDDRFKGGRFYMHTSLPEEVAADEAKELRDEYKGYPVTFEVCRHEIDDFEPGYDVPQLPF